MPSRISKFGLSWGVPHYRLADTFLEASFLPSDSFSRDPQGFLPTCTAFWQPPLLHHIQRHPFPSSCGCAYNCVYVCVCTALIYILTWFKSTPLSAIIITHLVKGSTQFFLHLRRAAAGVAHRRPANTPPALPGIQTASADTQSHYLPWCNGALLLNSSWRENGNARVGKCVSMYCRSKAVGIGRTGNKDSWSLFYGCPQVRQQA